MSAHLPGNPHVDGPVNYMAEMHAGGRSDQAMVASAMLALAHEQRTANLIALWTDPNANESPMNDLNYGHIAKQIKERLGL